MPIKIGLGLPQEKVFDLGKDIPLVAKVAEEIGYDSLYAYERSLVPESPADGMFGVPGLPWDDMFRSIAHPLTVLALAAAVTEHVELGTNLLVAGLHGKLQLALELATLDNVSGGRLTAGYGTGWSADEHAAAGVVAFERRGEAMDELLDVCAAVWGPDPVSYRGRTVTIVPSEAGPKPAHNIPVHLGGSAPRAMRRIVDRADGWLPLAMNPDDFAAQYKRLRDLAAERGREQPITVSLQTFVFLTPERVESDERPRFVGTLEQVIQDALAFTEAAPVDEFVFDVSKMSNAAELIDTAGALYSGLRAAGI